MLVYFVSMFSEVSMHNLFNTAQQTKNILLSYSKQICRSSKQNVITLLFFTRKFILHHPNVFANFFLTSLVYLSSEIFIFTVHLALIHPKKFMLTYHSSDILAIR